MALLYANENFPLPVVEELRHLGHDVQTMQDAGEAGKSVPDEQVLAFAIAESRALLSLNRKHFIYLHNANPDHSGIIVCSFDSDFSSQAHRIHTAIESKARLAGELIRINRPQR
jgi:Domain of unknown function (DUF5615)